MSDLPDITIPFELYGFSALDRYFGIHDPQIPIFALTTADPAAIAGKADSISFPGVPGIDAEALMDGVRVLFRCVDREDAPLHRRIPVMNFRYNPGRRVFRDPEGVYYLLRDRDPGIYDDDVPPMGWTDLAQLAVLGARYGLHLPCPAGPGPDEPGMPVYLQRLYLSCILTGKKPAVGLSLLMKSGFIARHWPDLELLDEIDHGKEYHPEGNVWQHTLETFSYRKTNDIVLGLSLLLHDIGKSRSVENDGNRFDRHAQIGRDMTARFLANLGFGQPLIKDVGFLVSRHMMPSMIAKLPLFRTEETMSHRLFPLLLEVYRCDISSTFRGPEGYYEACRVYREFLKHRKNPYRTAAGKKIFRTYVE